MIDVIGVIGRSAAAGGGTTVDAGTRLQSGTAGVKIWGAQIEW